MSLSIDEFDFEEPILDGSLNTFSFTLKLYALFPLEKPGRICSLETW